MDRDRSKIILRMLILSWVFMMLLIGALALLLLLAFHKTKDSISFINDKIQTLRAIEPVSGKDGISIIGPVGSQGSNGMTGPQGISGENGKDGTSVTTIVQQPIQGIQGPQGIQGIQGPIGPQGIPGKPAREVELRNNILTGDVEWRYAGDDEWQLLLKGSPVKVE